MASPRLMAGSADEDNSARGCFAPPYGGEIGILKFFAPPIFRRSGGAKRFFAPPYFGGQGGKNGVLPPQMGGKTPPQAENFRDLTPHMGENFRDLTL